MNRILVPVDLTDASLCAVEAALTLSREKKSQIYLIHVITRTPDRIAPGPGESAEGDAEMRKKYRAMEDFFLKKIRPQSRFACIVRNGVPAREILRFAREEGVDVIVLPVRADSPGDPVRAGGIADQIVRNAAVPVMIVKPGSPARKFTDPLPWNTEERTIMPYEERYLEEIRQRVCMKCIDRTPSGLCVASTYDSCAINRYLPEIIDIVLTTPGDNLDAYVARLREKVCSVCQHQSPDGHCDMRDDVECALDRYFPLVIEAIQEVHHVR
ncbi:MAG TPA: universal stress protein [Bacteroidota bacterium]|nr:universal stress protein [Bacteroidota bacterium]